MDEVIKTLEPTIQKIINQYRFIGLREEYLRNQMQKEIKQNIEKYQTYPGQKEKLFQIRWEKIIIQYIKNKVKENNQLIHLYINQNNESPNFIQELNDFLIKIEYEPTKEQAEELLKQNYQLKEYIKKIIERKQILKFKDEPIYPLIQIYASKKKITPTLEPDIQSKIPKEINLLYQYLEEINQYPVLTQKEIEKLISKKNQGDQKARQKLIESNLRLVVKIAFQKLEDKNSILDLIQDGNIGLIKAVENFNPKAGNHFSTYATICIKNSIQRGIYTTSRTIRIPEYLYRRSNEIQRTKIKLQETLGKEPTIKELAQATNLTEKQILDTIENIQDPISIETQIDWVNTENISTNNLNFMNLLATKENIENQALRTTEQQEIVELLKNSGLTEKEQAIVILSFGMNGKKEKSLEQIGNIYGNTRQGIGKAKRKALEKLKTELLKQEQDAHNHYLKKVKGR